MAFTRRCTEASLRGQVDPELQEFRMLMTMPLNFYIFAAVLLKICCIITIRML
jgi:hypothetical protein